jgi:hypothetical protein
MAFFGFHPHHEGLMLATLNLTSDAIRTGESLPFNQYGPFWTLPYLTMELLPLGGFTFLAQRFVSILLIFLSALMIRRISLVFFSRNTSLVIASLFLVTYPYGQPSIIWPSIPAQLALLVLTYSILQTIDSPKQIHILVAGLSTIFLLGSRIQIGFLSVLCTIAIFSLTRNFVSLARYVAFVALVSTLIFVILQSQGLVEDIIFDSFVFPFTYLDPNQQNWTLPRTSIVVGISLFVFFFALNRINNEKGISRIPLLVLAALFLGLLFSQFVNESIYLKAYARLYVGLFLFITTVLLFSLARNFKRRCTQFALETVLYLYSLVGAFQVFPLFDAFHAWYASTPLLIALPLIFRESTFMLRLRRKTLSVWMFSILLTCLALFGAQAAQSISNVPKPFPLQDVRGIFLTAKQASDLEKEFILFKSNIPKRAKVMNFCSNADPFFTRSYWSPASRFFVFWSAFSDSPLVERGLMEADFVTICTAVTELNDTSQRILETTFSKVGTGSDIYSWGLEWEIYKRNAN